MDEWKAQVPSSLKMAKACWNWYGNIRERFLDQTAKWYSYSGEPGTGVGHPAPNPDLEFWELERTAYEVGYELSHRSENVWIPLFPLTAGIIRQSPGAERR